MKVQHESDYRARRRDTYPDLTEFADAFYWQSKGVPGPMAVYLAKIDLVKASLPKPAPKESGA